MSTSADPKDAEMKAATARCKRSAACRRFQMELGGFEPPTSWVRFSAQGKWAETRHARGLAASQPLLARSG